MFRKGFLTKGAAWLTVLVMIMGMIPAAAFAGSPVLTVRSSVAKAGLNYTASSGTYGDFAVSDDGSLSVELTEGLLDISISGVSFSAEYEFKGWKITVADIVFGPSYEADSTALKEALSSAVTFCEGEEVFISSGGSLRFYGSVASDITIEAVFEAVEDGSLRSDAAPPTRGTESWDGETLTEPSIADGVYQIGTAAELAWFASKVNDGSAMDMDAVLTADIDLNSKQWTPIGFVDFNDDIQVSYSGEFSGNGHSITGLFIERVLETGNTPYWGLFGRVQNAVIRDLKVAGNISVSTEVNPATATVMITAAGIVAFDLGRSLILNCSSSSDINVQSTNSSYVGGVCGEIRDKTQVVGCSFAGNVSCFIETYYTTHYVYAGGICATCTGVIDGCRVTGNVSAQSMPFGNVYAGGIVSSASTVSRCYVTGNVGAMKLQGEAYPGAVAGKIGEGAAVRYCYYSEESCPAGGATGFEDSEGIIEARMPAAFTNAGFLDELNSASGLSSYDLQWSADENGLPVVTVFAEVPAWDGVSMSEPAFEDGAYQIYTPEELAWFSSKVNDGTIDVQSAVMKADIDLNGHFLTPIGNDTNRFTGTFDGGGYSVIMDSDINAEGLADIALFGTLENAAIKDLTVAGDMRVDLPGDGLIRVAGIAARDAGGSLIMSCHSKLNITVSTGSVLLAAGICAEPAGGSTIVGCSNSGMFDCMGGSPESDAEGGVYAGGICARVPDGCIVESCWNSRSAPISARCSLFGNCYVGGITGQVMAGGTVSLCYDASHISGQTFPWLGGTAVVGTVIGDMQEGSVVTNCYYLNVVQPRTGAFEFTDLEGVLQALSLEEMKGDDLIEKLSQAPSMSCYRPSWGFGDDGMPACIGFTVVSGIKYFRIDGADAIIDNFSHFIIYEIPFTSSLEPDAIAPEVACYQGVSTPASGETVDFSNGPVIYTAGDGTTYTVIITKEPFPFEGSGTEEDPYRIPDADALVSLRGLYASMPGYWSGKYWKQTDDIDMSGINFTPIASDRNPFKGCYDGGGYSIKNLTIDVPGNAGLFVYADDVVLKNIVLDDTCYISGTGQSVGGIVGSVGDGFVLIENCVNRGTVESKSPYNMGNPSYVGGIAGSAGRRNAVVKGCSNYGNVSFTVPSSNNAAGIVAAALNNVMIIDCHNYGNVTAPSASAFGGMSGSTAAGIAVQCYRVVGCSNSGTISGGQRIAGIVAKNSGSPYIESCYNTGLLVRLDNPCTTLYIGGIVADPNYNTIINNCYDAGGFSISSGASEIYSGSIAGSCSAKQMAINGNYFIGDDIALAATVTSGTADDTMFIPSSSAELKSDDVLTALNSYDMPVSLYRVTFAADTQGINKGYPVITGVEKIDSYYADMKSFSVTIDGKKYDGVIEGTDVSIVLPYGTDWVSPEIAVSDAATVSPASLEEVDLSKGPLTYTVTAENGREVKYTVNAKVAASPNGLVAMYVYFSKNDVIAESDFKQDKTTYDITIYASDCISSGNTQVYFSCIAAEQGASIVGDLNGKYSSNLNSVSQIGTQSGNLRCWGSTAARQNMQPGDNTITVTVTPPDGGAGQVTVYMINIKLLPSLESLSLTADGKALVMDKKFTGSTTSYSVDVPEGVTEIDINAAALMPEVTTVTLPEGSSEGKLDITGLERFTIRVGNDEIHTDYTVEIHRLKNYKAYVNASPADANVVITDPAGQSVHRQDDGSYLLTTNYKYTYNVTAQGYVGQSGEILRTEEDDYYLDVTLEKSSAAELPDVGAAWKNFRNSDYNLGITDAPTPVSAEEADLLWYTKMGENWSSAASVQIIVDDALIVMSGSVLYKVSLETGQMLASSEMAAAPDWGYTPPTYARGMIFCPLGKGTIQAFNAETLEPLWIYQDPLKGQSISPIAYSDGYIYTGFWNGEVGDANYVCISITDEDPTKTDEAKTASWSYTSNGGFYWAGAVVLGDYVVVGTDDGTRGFDGDSKLLCFDRHTGEPVSSITLSGMGDQRSSIAYDKDSGRVFFTTKNGYLASAMVDTQTGALTDLRSHAFPGSQSTSTPVVYKGRVYLGTGAGIGAAGQFVCADAETLEPIYTVDLLGYPQCSMLLSTAYEEKGELYFYSTYNALPGGITMIKADAVGSSAQAVEIYDAAEAPEYCITSIICGPDGTLYYKNDTGYVFAVGVADSSKVEKLIDAIGEVTLGSGDAIASARSAYDALDEDAKAKVSNYRKLLDAEDTLATLRADAVKAQIDALPSTDELTLDDEASVNSALAAYNALPSDAKAKLPAESKAKLDQAIARMSELRAQRVSDMIADLPEAKDVKLEDEADIRAARRAYSELSDDEKEMVSGLNKLIGAETALQKLKDQKPEGSTKSVTVTINGVTYEVSEATKAAVEAIQKILEPEDPSRALPEDFRDLTDEQEKEILDAYRLYNALTHDEKLFVNNFSGFEDILEKLGEKYHTDEATGVSVAGSNADLPWNIKAVIRPVKIDDSVLEKIREVLGEDAEMCSLYEISFVDVLTGLPVEPDMLMDITLPAPDAADGKMPVVIKLSDNGDILFAEADITDEGIVYTSSEGGSMGIAATSKSWDEILPSENTAEKECVSPIWFILAGIGVIGIIILLLWKRRRDEEEE